MRFSNTITMACIALGLCTAPAFSRSLSGYHGSHHHRGRTQRTQPQVSAREQQLVKRVQQYSSGVSPSTAATIVHHVVHCSSAYGVDPRLVLAVIGQESHFNPHAVSRTGACGLGQLMPGTAARLGVRHSFDIGENINGSVRLLSQLIHNYHGNIRYALAAYNAGPGRVSRYGGVPPIPETRHYVETISSHYQNMMSTNS